MQGDSPQALSLAKNIADKMEQLQDKVAGAVNHSERSGIKRPAHTLTGKVDQAQRWLNNPAVNDMGLGFLFIPFCILLYRGRPVDILEGD